MGNILSRIQEMTLNEGITIGALERKIGASKGVLSRAINNGTDIQSKWIEVLVDNYPQYSTRWLLTGRGSMLRSNQTQPAPQPAAQSIVQDSSSGEAAYIYKMYEKEKEENKALTSKMFQMAEEIGNLKAQAGTQKEPQAPDHPPLAFDSGFVEAFTEAPSGGSTKDYAHMRKPTTIKKSSASKT